MSPMSHCGQSDRPIQRKNSKNLLVQKFNGTGLVGVWGDQV